MRLIRDALRAEVERITTERDAIKRRTIERCAEVCEGFDPCDPKHIAAAIRALLEE